MWVLVKYRLVLQLCRVQQEAWKSQRIQAYSNCRAESTQLAAVSPLSRSPPTSLSLSIAVVTHVRLVVADDELASPVADDKHGENRHHHVGAHTRLELERCLYVANGLSRGPGNGMEWAALTITTRKPKHARWVRNADSMAWRRKAKTLF